MDGTPVGFLDSTAEVRKISADTEGRVPRERLY